MKIVNFGSCNIDFVYRLEHIVKVGETVSTTSCHLYAGGKGLNQSIAIARAGAKVYHAGCVGNDADMLTDLLLSSGVDISYLQRADAKNGHAIIQVEDSGNNSIFIYPGTNGMIYREYIDKVLDNFDKGDMLVLQNEISNVEYIIDKAYQKNMQIVFNPSPFNGVIKNIDLNKITYLMINEIEGEGLTGKDQPNDILNSLKKSYPKMKIILTLGEKGCMYSDESGTLDHPAYQVLAVDSTAAGDTFTGYFVACLSGGMGVHEALKYASAASSIGVSRAGAAPSIPLFAEVKNSLSYLKPISDNSKLNQVKRQMDEYIKDNLKTANRLELAKLLGYSAVYTGKLIKSLTGNSFSGYLQNMRCEAAAQMLASTNASIHDIITAVGYENESFFRKIFKEKYGKNPHQYRAESKK